MFQYDLEQFQPSAGYFGSVGSILDRCFFLNVGGARRKLSRENVYSPGRGEVIEVWNVCLKNSCVGIFKDFG